jgi:Mrr N-terminal domain
VASGTLTTEAEISEAVLRILAPTASGDATLGFLKKRIPNEINLTDDDLAQSQTRPNEPMWEQRLRNIKSHHKEDGNYIAQGFLTAPSKGRLRITDTGRKRVTG